MRTMSIVLLLALGFTVSSVPVAPAMNVGGDGECESAIAKLQDMMQSPGITDPLAQAALADAMQKCEAYPPAYLSAGTDPAELGTFQAGSGLENLAAANQCSSGIALDGTHAEMGVVISINGVDSTYAPQAGQSGAVSWNSATQFRHYEGSDGIVSFTADGAEPAMLGTIHIAGVPIRADSASAYAQCGSLGGIVCGGEGFAGWSHAGLTIGVRGNFNDC